MVLDLAALGKKPVAAPSGQPLDVPLDDIVFDPEQPRKTFDRDALQELARSIEARAAKASDGRGVISPVSIRPNPQAPGRWVLNHGERRVRASRIAGQVTVPAFIDEQHDEDDQAIENVQREGLEPIELAHHIRRQADKGRPKSDIAARLGKDKATITMHLALIDLPPALAALYGDGRCRSPRMLYDLRRVHEQHAETVDAWATRIGEVSRRDVDELKAQLRPAKPAPPAPEPAEEPIEADGAQEEPEGGSDAAAPAHIARPRLAVRHGERQATVLLDRRPSADGLLVIAYDDGTQAEVEAGECTIERLTDA